MIALAVLISGALAAVVAVILTVQSPLVTPTSPSRTRSSCSSGVVVGGIDRLWTATLGGFAIGFASGLLGGALPTDQSQYLPSVAVRASSSSSCSSVPRACSPAAAAPWSAYETP